MYHIPSNSQPDILLVTQPNSWQYGSLPYYYLTLCGSAQASGLRYEILDYAPIHGEFFKSESKLKFYKKKFDKAYFMQRLLTDIKRIKPKFIGFSIFTVDYFFTMEICKYLKDEKVEAKIILGNVHTSLFPDDVVYPGSPVDFGVIGEGEATMLELLKTNSEGGDLTKVPGLMFVKDGQVLKTGSRPALDITNLPLTPFEKVDMKYYLRPRRRLIRNIPFSGVDVFTGRGCPYFCSFCAANNLFDAQGIKKGVRYSALDTAFKNIDRLVKEYKVDAIYVLDDTFTVSKPRVMEFCERIKPYNLKWGAETRVNLVNDKILKVMRDAGCIQLDFGVETGADELLKEMSKGITTEAIKKCFALCHENGIRAFANMMVNMPEETEAHIEETEAMLSEIKPTVINVSIMKPYPATPIYDRYIKGRVEHFTYMKNLDDFISEDFSMFRVCNHNLNLIKLRNRIASHAYRSKKEKWEEKKIGIRNLLFSKRRFQYVRFYLEGFLIDAIYTLRDLKNKYHVKKEGKIKTVELLGTNDAYAASPWAKAITSSEGVRELDELRKKLVKTARDEEEVRAKLAQHYSYEKLKVSV